MICAISQALDRFWKAGHIVYLIKQLNGAVMLDVARRLRALRQARGLSQRELARLSGVSNGTISLIEKGRTDPTLGLMMKILEGVGVSVADFFSSPAEGQQQIFFTKDDMVDLGHGPVRLLQPGRQTDGRLIQILYEEYQPGSDTGVVPLKHEGEECGFIVEGRVEITVGERLRILGPGEGYYFPSHIPHRFRNVGETQAIVVSACTPPF